MANDGQILVAVDAVKRETETISAYELRLPNGEALPAFTPGAHIDVHLGVGLTRSYSLLSCSSDRYRYEIAVDRAEQSRGGSRWMHENVSVGTTLTISQPRNLFPLEDSAAHSVLIAGGIGITPLLAMARHLERHQRSWELYYCVRDPARAAFLTELLRPHSHGKVVMHFSDLEGLPNLSRMVSSRPPNTHFYCCGPTPMLDAFLTVTKQHPPEVVHIERFAGSEAATGASFEFDLILAGRQRTLRVRKGESILDTLLKEGVDVPNSCREGVCGSCEVQLLAGRADHRDLILTDAEKAANKSIFVCCSSSLSPSLTLDL